MGKYAKKQEKNKRNACGEKNNGRAPGDRSTLHLLDSIEMKRRGGGCTALVAHPTDPGEASASDGTLQKSRNTDATHFALAAIPGNAAGKSQVKVPLPIGTQGI